MNDVNRTISIILLKCELTKYIQKAENKFIVVRWERVGVTGEKDEKVSVQIASYKKVMEM